MRSCTYILLWLVFYFTASAAPTDGVTLFDGASSLIKRAAKDAGIGVELEVRRFELINEDPRAKNADDKMKAAIKGATLISGDGSMEIGHTCQPFWDLTAETLGTRGNGISDLTFEWIVRGEFLKMKASNRPDEDLVLPGVAKDIRATTKILDPKKGKKFYISTKYPLSQWGPWVLKRPDAYSEEILEVGVQVTTGLPMEAIQELITILARDPLDPDRRGVRLANEGDNENESLQIDPTTYIFGPPNSKRQRLVLIKAEDMEDIYAKEDITTDLLGFYSLLMSYVNIAANADETDREEGPKHRISIMPRTDFKTLYAMYGKDESTRTRNKKCKRKKKDPKYEKLIEIIKHLAQKKGLRDAGKIEKATFKWTKPPGSQTGPPVPPSRSDMQRACKALNLEPSTVDWEASWPTRTEDYRKGELSIESWVIFEEGKVDPLPLMENLLRGGQVGGLGDRVEKPLYPHPRGDEAYALYEIRDMSGGTFLNLEKYMERIETEVKRWHHDPPQYRDLKDNLNKRALGASCKSPNDDTKCKDNEVENAQGKCEVCKKGEKPDPTHKKCIPDKCKDNEVENAQGKCEVCKKGEKPDPTHKKCIPDKCTGGKVPNKQKNNQCEPCPKGTKPNVGNTLCIPDGPNKDEKGQCKDEGFILDPRIGGQDKNTKDPKCVFDDTRNCEKKGWVAVTRDFRNVVSPKDSKSYTPECAEDKDPDFRCKNSKRTYVHKKRDPDSDQKVIKKSCRSTQSRLKELKDKYNERVEKAKEQRKKTVDAKKQEMKERNRRERVGFCTALGLGLNLFNNLQGAVSKRDDVDFDSLSPDELDGMLGMWPEDDLDPDIIQDHMVTIGPKPSNPGVQGIDMETAGRASPIYWLAKGIQKLVKIFKKPGRSAPPSKTNDWYSGFKNAGGREKPSEKALNAAKASPKVKEIFNKDMMKQCLKSMRSKGAKRKRATPTQIDIDQTRIVIDWDAPRNNLNIPDSKYEDRVITVKLGQDTDNIVGEGGTTDWATTYPDRINRPGRLQYEACQQIPDDLKNKVTAVEVWGGCCGIYADNDCKESSWMFAMQDREDWQLDGDHNDNMEAVWCTFELNCKGAPGAR